MSKIIKFCKHCQTEIKLDLILCSPCKKIRDKKYRENENNKQYAKKYAKYYYLKKQLENPNYNKERKLREKELKLLKVNNNI